MNTFIIICLPVIGILWLIVGRNIFAIVQYRRATAWYQARHPYGTPEPYAVRFHRRHSSH